MYSNYPIIIFDREDIKSISYLVLAQIVRLLVSDKVRRNSLMKNYDVIVVGAGTAGTMTAMTIARRGHSRKRREKIGEKTCGDALASHHPKRLKDLIGLPDIPDNIVEHFVDSIDLIAPDREHRLRLDGPTIRGFTFNRLKLGQWLYISETVVL
jgi:flavin-dependent dehydrogenase